MTGPGNLNGAAVAGGDLLAVLPEAHWIVEPSGAVVAANRAAADLVAQPLDRMPGAVLTDLVADPPPKVRRYLATCARSPQMLLGALTFRRPDGREVPCRCDGALVDAGEGPARVLLRCRPKNEAITRFVALSERVDALNRAMALQVETELVLRRQAELLERTHDAVAVWDLETGAFTYLNRAAEELYGWRREEALGRAVHDLLQTEAAAVQTMRRQVRETGEWTGELAHLTRQGQRITVESRMVLVAEESGHPVVLETSRDVTEARRLRSQLEATQRLEAVGRLAGGAAHEINNALQGAVGFASFALRSLAEADPVREDVAHVLRACERAASITIGLLAFSRRQVLNPSNLSLGEAVASFAPMCRQALGPDRTLEVELPPQPIVVHADRGQLEQVLLNLALNARDATAPGGGFRLRMETATLGPAELMRLGRPDLSPGAYARLEAADSGHGMEPATLARVFEPFFTTKPPGQGTGLGLAVAHGIIHQSGGAIAVRSSPETGTTFTIYLPLLSVSGTRAPEDARAPVRGGKERVLVVDDDSVVLNVAARLLRHEGYTVVTAANGADALRYLDEAGRSLPHGERPVDIILSDIVMPGVDGRELGLELAERYPSVPVLYTSGYPGEEMVHRGLLLDGAAFIPKPFTPDQLLTAIRGLLDSTISR